MMESAVGTLHDQNCVQGRRRTRFDSEPWKTVSLRIDGFGSVQTAALTPLEDVVYITCILREKRKKKVFGLIDLAAWCLAWSN